MIDPPSGWRYGFPKAYDKAVDGSVREWLLKNGYPEKDIELALQYSRMWYQEYSEE